MVQKALPLLPDGASMILNASMIPRSTLGMKIKQLKIEKSSVR
jgi:hypothetical protein